MTIEEVGVFRLQSLLSSELREVRNYIADNVELEREALLCACLVDADGTQLHRLSEASRLDLDAAVVTLLSDCCADHLGQRASPYDWHSIIEVKKN